MDTYLSPASFWLPEFIDQSAWIDHAPFAFWLIEAHQPRSFVELGTYGGYSYFTFCQAVGALGLDTRCYAVDTWKGDEHAGFYGEAVYQRVRDYNDRHYAAFSRLVRSSFDEAVAHFPDASIDLLHIDGRHFYEDVKHDFETWRPKLSERAVVLFHDTNVRERNFGVFRLWEELQTEFPSFEFLHGHGLGVLGYGANLPDDVAAFLTATNDSNVATEVRLAYNRLGAALKADVEAKNTQSQLTARLSKQEALAGALEAKLEGREREVKDLAAKLQAQEARTGALDATLAMRDLVIRELRNSTSWRITAPLRAVSRGARWSARNIRRTLKLARWLGTGQFSRAANALLPYYRRYVPLRVKAMIPYRLSDAVKRRLERGRLRTLSVEKETNGSAPIAGDDAYTFAKVRASSFIVATPHTLFYAKMMERCLRAEGFTVTISLDVAGHETCEHVFVICPQMFDKLPKIYTAIQMEQSVSSRWFTNDYFAKLKNAKNVLEYSLYNIDYLTLNNIDSKNIYYVPLGVNQDLYDVASIEISRNSNTVLFYGDDKCARREYLLSRLRSEFDVVVVNNKFSADMSARIRSAAVVVNIHYYEGALLETTRIYEVLSHGVPIVSEKSADFEEHGELHRIVNFVEVGDIESMMNSIRRILSDRELRAENLKKIERFVLDKGNRFENYFRRFLLGQNMISFDRFAQRAVGYAPPTPAEPRICLSLPETTARRRAFLAQGRKDFMVWDGLKSQAGWVGCALSFKHIFATLCENKTEVAIICEDDAVFGEDFDLRFQKIMEYLGRKDNWDIFSGFIADFSEDANIIDVEERDGEVYIYVDRVVSTVFNVYKRNVIEFLSKWDSNNNDVWSNTIDRYLERRENTVAITTLPFLVSHREDVSSTVWGFPNTQYIDLVKKSKKILEKKVEQFLSRRRRKLVG